MKYVVLFLLITFFSSCNNDKIAYLSNRSGNFDIFITDQEGKTHFQLTKNNGWDWAPKWNEHLQAIIYNSNDTLNQFSFRAKKVDGKNIDLQSRNLKEFNLSPDGTMVLYTEKSGKNRLIGIYNMKTRESRLVVRDSSYNGRPRWAPNNSMFSFLSDRDGNTELYVYKLSSGEQIRLTNSEKREKYTSWTPDSKSIVYTYHYSDERDNEHNDIFRVYIATKENKQITNDKKFYQEICVSPNGKKIAFHAKRDGKHHIYTIDINGKNENQITSTNAYHGEPEWIPSK